MKIVVVGAGVAGLVAAEILGHEHEVTVLEAAERPGGHAHTVEVSVEGRTMAVDTGFVVFNEPNYPLFTRLLKHLGVPRQQSDMSFSVQHLQAGIEYAACDQRLLRGLLAQPSNLLRPGFWRMLRDLKRLWREAPGWLEETGPDLALDERLRRGGYGRELSEWHLYPMVAALWSAPADNVRGFPSRTLATFFAQHGFFARRGRPAWFTVTGGSTTYVARLTAALRATLVCGTPVRSVRRGTHEVEVRTVNGSVHRADHVVLALHPDQALALLDDATALERDVLGAVVYQDNDVLLHTDTTLLPRRKAAWASWNTRVPRDAAGPATVTYLMNRLHDLPGPPWLMVSLNQSAAIDPRRVLGRLRYRHPQATAASVAARARHGEVSGSGRTHFVGAGWGHGFHEDGVRSAVEACARLGAHPRW